MSSTAEASIPSTPRVVLGPAHSVLLICTFVTLILYGVALYQAHEFYYVQSEGPNQHIFNYYVAGLVILDAVHTILAIHTNYRNLVTNYLFPDRLNDPIWSLNLQPLVTGLVIVACQVFFARRVYLVDKMYRPLVKYTGGMFVVELACAVAFTIIAFRTSTVHQLNDYSWLQSGGYGVVISADAIMTTVLVVALHRGRSEFYKSGTNSLLDILTRYAIYTGLLTAILATICFISALILPNNLLFGAFDLICVKVYINSVLAALNARSGLAKHGRKEHSEESIFLSIRPLRPGRTNENQSVHSAFASPSVESSDVIHFAVVGETLAVLRD